uniref:RH25074p1 n=1 Tax=Drosophila melanogaster TaxID=7227 RepID=G7H841_DROME|nr:RH25074p1 [Drosophila melanogaster]
MTMTMTMPHPDHRITGSPDHRITGYPRQQDSNDPATPLSAFQFHGMYLFGRLSVNLRSGNLLSLLLCAYNAPKCDHNK